MKSQCARLPQSSQSVHAVHDSYSAPAPPSSHSSSRANTQVLTHVPLPGGPGAGDGGGGDAFTPGDGGGLAPPAQLPGSLGPQSAQSSHGEHVENSLPCPPSSQSPSDAKRHVFRHSPDPGGPGGGGAGDGGDGGCTVKSPQCARGPQSAQSVHAEHDEYCEPLPPSSHSPSSENVHVLTQVPPPGGAGTGGGAGNGAGGNSSQLPARRGPQSAQSVHAVHV